MSEVLSSPTWSPEGIHMLRDIGEPQSSSPGSSYFLHLQLRSAVCSYGVLWKWYVPTPFLRSGYGPRGLVSKVEEELERLAPEP